MPNRKWMLWAIVIAILSLTTGGITAQDRAAWTVMVYMEADNNLENDALVDIIEMEMVGSSPDVNIVVQIDRAVDFATGDGDWTDARRYLLTKNNGDIGLVDIINQKFASPETITLTSEPVDNLGEINNGDPGTLVDFIVWAAETYPADKYGLILWNHGGTWTGGFGGDSSTPDHDSMNLPELDAALSLATDAIGQNFEMIGFDTCLMGQYEVFSLLANYANYATGSEELEPGFGWYYTAPLQALVDDPSMGGDQLSQNLVISYQWFYDQFWLEQTGKTYSDFFGGDFYGQTAANLSQMAALDVAMANFSAVAQANMDASLIAAIGDARNNTQSFLLRSPDDAPITATVDLMHFMELLPRFSDNADVNAAAQAVAASVNDLVLLHMATNMPGARGLSIYFPANQRAYTAAGYDARYPQEAPYMAEWIAFLNAFHNEAIITAAATVGRVSILDVVSRGDTVDTLNPPTIIFETEGTNITELSFSAVLKIDDQTQVMIDQASLDSAVITEAGDFIVDIPDGVSLSNYTWPVDMPVVTDGSAYVPTVLLESGDDESVIITGLYGFPNGETLNAYVVFDLETNAASQVWGINEGENGGQPFEIVPTTGDEFLPTWRFFDDAGDIVLIPAEEALVFSDAPFTFEFMPAASGLYAIYIHMTDVAGNVFTDVVEITVENDAVQGDYRGENDVNNGYSYVYPWDWAGPLDVESEAGNYTVLNDNAGVLTVYFRAYDVESFDEMEAITIDYLESFSADYSEPYAAEVDGREAVNIEYYATNADETEIYGLLLVTYVEETGIGYIVDYEVTGETTDEAGSYYKILVDSLTFFAPSEN